MTNSNTPRLPSLVLSLPFDSFFLFFSVSFRVVFSGSDSPEGQKRHGGRRDGTTNRRKVGEMSHSSIEARNKEKERERKGKREEKGILPRIYEHKGGEGGQKGSTISCWMRIVEFWPSQLDDFASSQSHETAISPSDTV